MNFIFLILVIYILSIICYYNSRSVDSIPMEARMSDRYLIDYCSPTLASIKSASLFHCRVHGREDLDLWLAEKNREFLKSGLRLIVLQRRDDSALVYLFRISALRAILRREDNRQFLLSYGYPDGREDLYGCLSHLKERIASSKTGTFPHEIGIFLGYPLGDVRSFIQYHGQAYKLSGLWKVYGSVEEAVSCFRRFRKCKEVYQALYSSGRRNVIQLTVPG
jgi:hypothetical protein